MREDLRTSPMDECRFCTRPDPDRIILWTEHCYVMLSLGPLVEGYTLILSREHVDCCAAITPPAMTEFTRLERAVVEAQIRVYGKHLRYEHGRAGACLPTAEGERHCHHAHLHCVPIALDLKTTIGASFPIRRLKGWPEVAAYYASSGTPYLLVSEEKGFAYFEAEGRVPRQYLRRLVAAGLGKPQLADWVAFPGYDLIAKGKERLAPIIRDCYVSLAD